MTTLRFLHSPFIGADTWHEVSEVMERFGWEVACPSLAEAFAGREPYLPALAEAVWRDAPADERTVLIAHSGAGAIIPSALALRNAEAVVLVDAVVPSPGSSWRLDAPAELTERLDAFTDCGLLPEWHRWFSARLLRQMLPDDEMSEDFIDALPRVPASFLDEVVPDVAAWPPAMGAYLQLSETYDEEAGKAERLGLRLSRFPLHHLAMMTMAEDVADALQVLLDAMRIEGA